MKPFSGGVEKYSCYILPGKNIVSQLIQFKFHNVANVTFHRRRLRQRFNCILKMLSSLIIIKSLSNNLPLILDPGVVASDRNAAPA